jgi:hypothetical protein
MVQPGLYLIAQLDLLSWRKQRDATDLLKPPLQSGWRRHGITRR